jgi:hypothetical protein
LSVYIRWVERKSAGVPQRVPHFCLSPLQTMGRIV